MAAVSSSSRIERRRERRTRSGLVGPAQRCSANIMLVRPTRQGMEADFSASPARYRLRSRVSGHRPPRRHFLKPDLDIPHAVRGQRQYFHKSSLPQEFYAGTALFRTVAAKIATGRPRQPPLLCGIGSMSWRRRARQPRCRARADATACNNTAILRPHRRSGAPLAPRAAPSCKTASGVPTIAVAQSTLCHRTVTAPV